MLNNQEPSYDNTSSTELIPITRTDDGTTAVMGRDIHAFLESKEPYTRWIARHVEKYGFVAGKDFLTKMSESTGGRPAEDHVLTMDMAKELAMLQGNARGRQARRYFIEVEKQYRAKSGLSVDVSQITRLEIAQMLVNAETERLALEAKNKQLEPKADAYDAFLDATGSYAMGTVAKMLGVGANRLFMELRNRGVLISKGAMWNTPYQRYMRYFVVKAHHFEKRDGDVGVSYTTYVQPSGIDFIRRRLELPTIDPVAFVV